MNREQAKLIIRNHLAPIRRNQEDVFLDDLLSNFDDPEGWLKFLSESECRRIINKHYYKTFRFRR